MFNVDIVDALGWVALFIVLYVTAVVFMLRGNHKSSSRTYIEYGWYISVGDCVYNYNSNPFLITMIYNIT